MPGPQGLLAGRAAPSCGPPLPAPALILAQLRTLKACFLNVAYCKRLDFNFNILC
jgi:hypothetical protein